MKTFAESGLAGSARPWFMAPADREALWNLAARIRPKVAIEVGTGRGGSLQVLARLCEKVYTIDIDPDAAALAADKAFKNVQFVVGDSAKALPALLKSVGKRHEHPTLVLLDGNNEPASVKADIDAVLKGLLAPKEPTYLLVHDCFHPRTRAGIATAAWSKNKHVQAVEIDSTVGVQKPDGQLWNGFAVALLDSRVRKGPAPVTFAAQAAFDQAMKTSPQRT